MKVDTLVFAAHPDDAELACSGTIAGMVAKGKKVAIVDLTQGEMGTRGNADSRKKEAQASTGILGISERWQLNLPDTTFGNSREEQHLLIQAIRYFQPRLVLANAISDRHPDHGRAAKLAEDACFYSGLPKIETFHEGKKQEAWRPSLVLHYVQSDWIQPDVIVDISPYWDIKIKAIKSFKTQFFDPESQEPETFISTPRFLKFIECRARDYGHLIHVEMGEGFTCRRPIGVSDLSAIF
jgi:bacillithiol biosynthesis deacetylase BshB1